MCFHIHPRHTRIKTAKKDIACFKVLEKDEETSRWYSPWQDTEYRNNRLKKAKIDEPSWSDKIHQGLHSFSTKSEADFTTSNGFNREVFEAIIPEGSQYYYNPDEEEYVSNQLMVIKRIKNK